MSFDLREPALLLRRLFGRPDDSEGSRSQRKCVSKWYMPAPPTLPAGPACPLLCRPADHTATALRHTATAVHHTATAVQGAQR